MYKTEQEAREAFLLEAGDDFIEFEGHNCNDWLDDDQDGCAGWQVGERRCECGNRRVDIAVGGDAETGFYVYAYAY